MTARIATFAPSTYANVGSLDRLARFGLGMLLIVIGLVGQEPLGANVAMMLVAIPLVITALMAWDPFYALLGIRTATLRAPPEALSATYAASANEGPSLGWFDRIGRFGLGAALLSVTLLGNVPIEWAVSTALASIPVIMTGVMGWDPFYHLAGIRTTTLPVATAAPYSAHAEIKVFDLYDEAPPVEWKKAA
jgi:hypothetical protein